MSPSYGRPDLIMFWNLLMAVLNFFPVPVTEECLSDDSRRTGKVLLFILYICVHFFIFKHTRYDVYIKAGRIVSSVTTSDGRLLASIEKQPGVGRVGNRSENILRYVR